MNIVDSNVLTVDKNVTVNDDSKKATKSSKSKPNKKQVYGEGSIFQRKSDKRWVSQIIIGTKPNGKPNIKCLYSKTESEAKKKLKEYRIEMILNSNKSPDKNPDVTLEDFFWNWLQVKFKTLKPSSADRLESVTRTHVINKLGHIEHMKELTTQDIQNLVINQMEEDGLSYSTIKHAYDAINAGCKYAMGCVPQIITQNPCANVVLPKKSDIPQKKIRWFTDDERFQIEQSALATYKSGKRISPIGEIFLFDMETGLRTGELLAITWNDIVEIDGIKCIRVNKGLAEAKDRSTRATKKRKMFVQSTKTKNSNREVPLTKKALEYLESIKQTRYFGNNKCIFCNTKGEPLMPNNVRRMFWGICERAGIEGLNESGRQGIHVLRHTFASRLFHKGIDIKAISMLLGHSSVQITYDIYVHLAKEQQAQAIFKLDEI